MRWAAQLGIMASMKLTMDIWIYVRPDSNQSSGIVDLFSCILLCEWLESLYTCRRVPVMPVCTPTLPRLCSSMERSVCCWIISLHTSIEIAPSGIGPIMRPSLSSRKIRQAIILDTVRFGGMNRSERKDGLKTKMVVKMLNTTVILQVLFQMSCDAREPIGDSQVIRLPALQ